MLKLNDTLYNSLIIIAAMATVILGLGWAFGYIPEANSVKVVQFLTGSISLLAGLLAHNKGE